jgi:photosystem II stability/assembly factor-like uncharacterized protein
LQIYHTEDGGDSWQELAGFRRVSGRWLWRWSPAEPPFKAYIIALAVSPGDRNVLLAGIELGAVTRSADGGRTWSGHRQGAGRDCHQLIFHPVATNWAYQAAGDGPAVSQDAGQTWHKPKKGLDRRYCFNVAADPARPEVWYAVTAPLMKAHSGNSQACVFRSVGSASWEKLSGGLPAPFDTLPILATRRAAPGHLYLSTMKGDVWHSADYGDTWEQMSLNLGRVWWNLTLLESDPAAPDTPL